MELRHTQRYSRQRANRIPKGGSPKELGRSSFPTPQEIKIWHTESDILKLSKKERGDGLRRRYETDGEGYRLYDSGCYTASRYIGEASRCLGCPFGKCILDFHSPGRVRNDLIQQLVTSKTGEVKYGIA